MVDLSHPALAAAAAAAAPALLVPPGLHQCKITVCWWCGRRTSLARHQESPASSLKGTVGPVGVVVSIQFNHVSWTSNDGPPCRGELSCLSGILGAARAAWRIGPGPPGLRLSWAETGSSPRPPPGLAPLPHTSAAVPTPPGPGFPPDETGNMNDTSFSR
ncbi:hypothetical protein E2C01_054922 [Portunus trituberculatus]|uniref:Uncharacterized protein n=1 Tax=Portunus trituberculatus TaxID=210409 RepID=A0A5B7GTC4_PORTR|nr:hypothetical protein [Portunus trituberculatus]